MKLAFIYNAASGRHSSKNIIKIKRFVGKEGGYKLFMPDGKDQIPGLVYELKASFDGIIACGGDGTVHTVAQELINCKTVLGIVPLGSGNDFIKSLNIPNDIESALQLLQNGKLKQVDTGRCNDFVFVNTLGFGFDGLTNRYSYDYQRLGPTLRYFCALMKANANRNDFKVKVSGDLELEHKAMMVSIANGLVEGGRFWIAPEASITDGVMSLVIIDPVNSWKLPAYLPLILARKIKWLRQYRKYEIRKVALQFNRHMDIHADGEIIKTGKQKFEIEVLPSSLKVICPK